MDEEHTKHIAIDQNEEYNTKKIILSSVAVRRGVKDDDDAYMGGYRSDDSQHDYEYVIGGR